MYSPNELEESKLTGLLRIVHSGEYLDDCKIAEPMAWASDAGNAEKLWEVSEVLVGEKFDL